jgi:hypothetical protein
MHLVKLTLTVHYTDGYPDELPDLSLDTIHGEVSEEARASLIDDLRAMVRDAF